MRDYMPATARVHGALPLKPSGQGYFSVELQTKDEHISLDCSSQEEADRVLKAIAPCANIEVIENTTHLLEE